MSALSPRESFEIKTEYDVISTLRESGHDVHVLGVQWELRPVREAVDVLKPDIVFNLMEEFHGETVYDHNVVSFLELMKVPYTGCNPRGLMLSRGKALSKKLLALPSHPRPRLRASSPWAGRCGARSTSASRSS